MLNNRDSFSGTIIVGLRPENFLNFRIAKPSVRDGQITTAFVFTVGFVFLRLQRLYRPSHNGGGAIKKLQQRYEVPGTCVASRTKQKQKSLNIFP